jgi:hypothetical protein
VRPEWTPRVPRWKIRTLYAREAAGILDEELIDDVGLHMLARCRDIVTATAAHNGVVRCPSCSGLIERTLRRSERLVCPGCSWTAPWDEYHRSYRKKQLVGGAALPAVERFGEDYPRHRSARERFLAIHVLIHHFHGEVLDAPVHRRT